MGRTQCPPVDRRTPSSPLLPYDLLKPKKVIMVVPDSVKEKVGELPDISGMSKDDLSALGKQLYDQSCAVSARSSTWSTPSRRGTWRSTTSRWRPASPTAPSRSPS